MYCLCIGILAAVSTANAQLADDFAIKTLPIKSDENLNAKRIGCAFGDMPKILANLTADGYPTPDVTDYCVAIMQEAAKRGNQGDLYSRMQPNGASAEFKIVLKAAKENKTSYVNVENINKQLNCELAFDAGYMYGSLNPDQPFATDTPDKAIEAATRDCFTNPQTPTLSGILAGARNAKAHANGKRILHADATN